MNRSLRRLALPITLILCFLPGVAGAREAQIEVDQILQTTQARDGTPYKNYPTGQPQLTVLRIKGCNTIVHLRYDGLSNCRPKRVDGATMLLTL